MGSDYFANHRRGVRFPWSLYHRPLERSLDTFLDEVSKSCRTARLLVIGAGFLHELERIPANIRVTAVDADPRVTARLKAIRDDRLVEVVTASDADSVRALGPFDALYAKEVVEHIIGADRYVAKLVDALRPCGRVWLSTPNYGDPLLPFLEGTILELIARHSGFSRKDIHPTRFTAASLAALLGGIGLERVDVQKTRLRLALIATASKPRHSR